VPREPVWVPRIVVEAIHLDQVRAHGGLAGLRDEQVLESALARARQRWSYDPETDVPTLAAAYGFGLCQGHPFRDGNKRMAFITMVVFLMLNGWQFEAPESEVVTAMLAVAEGKSTEADLAGWVHARSTPKKRPRNPAKGSR
jgi:death-on-curing protein